MKISNIWLVNMSGAADCRCIIFLSTVVSLINRICLSIIIIAESADVQFYNFDIVQSANRLILILGIAGFRVSTWIEYNLILPSRMVGSFCPLSSLGSWEHSKDLAETLQWVQRILTSAMY